MNKKVFVTGIFDLLHSGHVAFLQEAAQYGDLWVCLGSDETARQLKGYPPVNSQAERRFMIKALSCVKDCVISSGSGILDFLAELDQIAPDIFFVNEDGNTPAKVDLCRSRGLEYIVAKRIPFGDLPHRRSESLRAISNIPFRIDLAGGWLDQPFVSRFAAGPVLTISIEPTIEFNDRSGMASSTRKKAIELWKTDIPASDPLQLAKLLFSYENPPGTAEVAGSQDSLGIVLPGLNKLNYRGEYWPTSVESVLEEEILSWLENNLYLVTLGPRISSFRVLDRTEVTPAGAAALSAAAENCWKAILARDIRAFGAEFRHSFEAQIAMFPCMVDDEILRVVDQYRHRALGWKLSGAGGGGYLILVSDQAIPGAFHIKIRSKDRW